MVGEIDPVSHKLGEMEGKVTTLVTQQSALFRQNKVLGDKIDALTVSFTGYSQTQLAALSAVDTKAEQAAHRLNTDVYPHIEDYKTFNSQYDERAKAKAREKVAFLGVGGAAGGILSQAIEFLKSIGHT